MAINESQKVDWLWKKLGYGVAKTDINSIKAATNESIASPLLIRGDNIWQDASQIPSTKPTASTTTVEIYDDSGNGQATVECTPDLTASPNRTWNTNSIDWIPTEFGSTYQIKVYLDSSGAATPQSTGTQLFAAGSGNNDEWYFDYQSGVLNFIGDNLPAGIAGNVIYVVGARYIGNKGSNLTSATIANFTFNGNTIGVTNTNGDIILDPDGTGKLSVLSDTEISGNLTVTGSLTSLTVSGATSLLGDVTIGDADTDTITINGDIRSNVLPDITDSYDLGATSKAWRDIYLTEALTFEGASTENEIVFPTNLADGLSITDGTNDFIVFDSTTGSNLITITPNTAITGTLGVTGESTLASATISDVTATHIMYAGTAGSVDGDANLVWDGTQLAVGVTNFTVQHATGNVYTAGTLETDGQATLASANVEDLTDNRIVIAGNLGELEDDANFTFDGTTFKVGTTLTDKFTVDVATGNTAIAGTLDIDGQATLASANIEDLTDNRIVIAGTSGELEDDANFTFDGTELNIGAGNFTVQQATGNTYTAGDLQVAGNLQVDGTTTTVNSTVVTIDDPIFTLGGDQTPAGDDNKDRGIEFKWHDGVSAKLGFFGYDDSASVFTFIPDATNTSEVFSGTAGNVAFGDGTFTGATAGNIQIGITGDNEIDTSSGNLTIDSAGGTVTIDDNAEVTGSLTVTNLSSLNGGIAVDANFTVDGATGAVYTASTLDVDGQATLASANVEDLTDNQIVVAGALGELEGDANLRYDGTSFMIGPAGTETFKVTVLSGNTEISGNLTLGGNITIGDADTDNITLSGELTSHIVPDATDTYDLGTTTKGWRDLFITEDIQFLGATGENRILIPANTADALSITDGTNDLIVLNSSTGVLTTTITALAMANLASTTTIDRILDEDTLASNSDVALATQQSIKAYVDNSLGNVDLNFIGDGPTNGTVNLGSQSFTLSGTANEIETSAANQTITIGLPNDVTITNNLTVSNNLGVTAAATIGTTLQVGTDATILNDLGVGNSAQITNDLSVGNDATVTRDLTVNRNATITGDLTVSGTTTYINTTTLNVGDNIITLNADITNVSSPTEDSGIEVLRGTEATKSFIWDETNDKWTAGNDTIEAGLFEGDIDGGTY